MVTLKSCMLLLTAMLSVYGQPSQKNAMSNYVERGAVLSRAQIPCHESLSEDEAGISLCSSSEDEAGISLCSSSEDEAGISLCSSSEDEAGISLCSSSEDEGGISLDSSSEELTLEMIDPYSAHKEVDFETVNAKLPPLRNINSYIFSEVSSGNKMKSKATSLLSIKSALKDRCVCGEKCLEKVNFKTVRELRNSFWFHSKTMRMQLLKYYISHSKKKGIFRFIHVEQFTLCSKAFCSVFWVNKNTLSRAIQMNSKNVATVPGKNPRDMSEKTLLLINWLEDYGTYHGDRMPDTVDILLPYKTVKTDLYWK
ncbi:uncharacterized protein LOC128558898 [Mercenaria mercenaria]|uniref:uncharacterized protein LOC128558898 n=1 Tax=Mercenaria mercenaria TaxID=6596 RepID=UPI00234F2F34|nr:uncharacterized protein LOC128558898 [Mercenaria mercenaria]